jgi:hypothetical protein
MTTQPCISWRFPSPAVFAPTGGFKLTGMTATEEQDIPVTFSLTRDGSCPGNTNPALQPQVFALRRNCDGTVPKAAVQPQQLSATAATCANGVYAAIVTAVFVGEDKCFGIVIRLADGQRKLALVASA